MRRRVFVPILMCAAAAAQTKETPWLQWGGPNRNFQTESAGLADHWPAAGPRVLWKRALGEGYSSILVENGVLYTMYGRPGQEITLAASAATGKTIWERANPVQFHNDAADRGNGPHATPLIVGDRLFTTGVTGRLECLDKKTGKLLWTHALWDELKGSRLIYGYAASPLAYRDLVLLPVGGAGHAIAAFRQTDGAVVWQKDTAGNAYSSPLLVNVDGIDQVVQLMAASVFAVNPLNGELAWHMKHDAPYGLNVTTPVWGSGNLLFVATGYGAGSRVIEVKHSGNSISAKELWYSNRFGIHHGNAIRLGDALYFSSGNGPAPFTAVDIRTGKVLWQNREFPKVTMVYADGKLIVLDEDGNLALAQVSPQGVHTLAKVPLLANNAWTPPTLVGTKLYIRDRRSMTAVELGR
jgi:outer membrane protein assembly factor BamB